MAEQNAIPEQAPAEPQAQAPKELFIPWPVKREEMGALPGDEGIIAQTYQMNENVAYFFMWWLVTYG